MSRAWSEQLGEPEKPSEAEDERFGWYSLATE
jgi:hypothetical protein